MDRKIDGNTDGQTSRQAGRQAGSHMLSVHTRMYTYTRFFLGTN